MMSKFNCPSISIKQQKDENITICHVNIRYNTRIVNIQNTHQILTVTEEWKNNRYFKVLVFAPGTPEY